MKNGQTTHSVAVEIISMNLIAPFPNHLFYIIDDNEMIELIESIRKKRSYYADYSQMKRRPV